MPIGFLSTAKRKWLNRFPEQFRYDDLSVSFLLSEADYRSINKQREDLTRFGFTLQLCALHYLGSAPDDLTTTPWDAVVFVAQQLDLPTERSMPMAVELKPARPTSNRSRHTSVFASTLRWISTACTHS